MHIIVMFVLPETMKQLVRKVMTTDEELSSLSRMKSNFQNASSRLALTTQDILQNGSHNVVSNNHWR
jgi:transcription termination factor NusB